MDFIDEEDTRDEFGDTVVDIPVDDFVDLEAEFLGDLGLLGPVDLAHEGEEVVAALGSGVGNI